MVKVCLHEHSDLMTGNNQVVIISWISLQVRDVKLFSFVFDPVNMTSLRSGTSFCGIFLGLHDNALLLHIMQVRRKHICIRSGLTNIHFLSMFFYMHSKKEERNQINSVQTT